jgi:prophage regulatory protein
VGETGASLLALKDCLPGFGLFLTRKDRMVYAVQYERDGKLVTEVIGTVNKITVKKARKIAAKLLSENQITTKPAQTETKPEPTQTQTKPEPAQTRTKPEPAQTQTKPEPTQTQITGANRKSESSISKDRTRPQQTKAQDAPSPIAKVPRKLVPFDELKETYSILYSRRHIDRLEVAGDFPKRVPIGAGRVLWVASEIEAYVEQRVAARSTGLGTVGSGRKRAPT